MAMGYSAILLPQLKNTTGDLHADDEMGSWIGKFTRMIELRRTSQNFEGFSLMWFVLLEKSLLTNLVFSS